MRRDRPTSAADQGTSARFTETASHRIVLRLRLDDLLQLSPTAGRFGIRLRSLVMSQTQAIDLRPGDGYILLNDRWLHGRTIFSGDRHMMRIIGEPLPGADLPFGFLPLTSGVEPLDSAATT